jgi:phosphotransferase system  glucose/maltose/N-acetylglucosamine-specific IIC component
MTETPPMPPPPEPQPPQPPQGYWHPYPMYPVPVVRPTNTLAIVALILVFVFPPVAIVLGAIARSQIRQSGEQGDGMALAGIIGGSIATALYVGYMIFMFSIFANMTNWMQNVNPNPN